ncbi:MAG TPA: hypothetical protein VGC85_00670 [Chthoniobacterales bacterium]
MKTLKLNILVIAATCTAAIVSTGLAKPKPNAAASPAASAAPTKIVVNVQCLNCAPPSSSKQTASPVKGGGYTVDAPVAGEFKISYAEGPNKGKTIATVTAGSAGAITFALNGQSTAPGGAMTAPH